jgi:hypothetical protein
MNPFIQFKGTIPSNSIYGLLLTAFALTGFGPLPSKVCGVVPAPDGGYPGANTAEGDGALQSLTSGVSNTAFGFDAFSDNGAGNHDTAIGIGALTSNTIGNNNTANAFGALLHDTTGSKSFSIIP